MFVEPSRPDSSLLPSPMVVRVEVDGQPCPSQPRQDNNAAEPLDKQAQGEDGQPPGPLADSSQAHQNTKAAKKSRKRHAQPLREGVPRTPDWTDADIEIVRNMLADGYHPRQIAEAGVLSSARSAASIISLRWRKLEGNDPKSSVRRKKGKKTKPKRKGKQPQPQQQQEEEDEEEQDDEKDE